MRISLRTILLFQAFASTAMLGTALVSQYGFSLHPCHLCILQRYPYAAVMALGLGGALFARKPKHWQALIWLNLLIWLIGAGIAGYHAGVEAGVFPGPESCTTSGGADDSLEALRAEILNAPLVSCAQAMAHFLGLSMAAWNAIGAVLLAVITVFLLRRRKA